MKIGIVTNSLAIGGAERQAAEWASACAHFGGHDVRVLALMRLDKEYDVASGIDVRHLDKRHRLDVVRIVGSVRRLARDVDVVIAFQAYPAVCCLLAQVPVPSIVVLGEDPRYHLSQPITRVPGWLIRAAIRRATATSLPTPELIECYQDLGVRAHHWQAIPNIAAGPAFVNGNHSRSGALFVGRLEDEKDPVLAIEAAELAGCRLTILGDGSLKTDVERRAAQSGLVALEPFTASPWKLYARHRVLVVTSRRETFGNVIVESLAAGTPAISVDCDFGPREILKNVKYSQLVERQPQAIASALREITTRPYSQAEAQECRELAARYRADAVAPAILDLIEASISTRRKPPRAPTATGHELVRAR